MYALISCSVRAEMSPAIMRMLSPSSLTASPTFSVTSDAWTSVRSVTTLADLDATTSTIAVRTVVLSAERIAKVCVRTSKVLPATARRWSSACTVVRPPRAYTRSAAYTSML